MLCFTTWSVWPEVGLIRHCMLVMNSFFPGCTERWVCKLRIFLTDWVTVYRLRLPINLIPSLLLHGVSGVQVEDFGTILTDQVKYTHCDYHAFFLIPSPLMHRVLGVQVAPENRRNILADLLTVYANAGKTIVFTQTKREADEVAAGIAGVIPSEVTPR